MGEKALLKHAWQIMKFIKAKCPIRNLEQLINPAVFLRLSVDAPRGPLIETQQTIGMNRMLDILVTTVMV